MKGLEMLKEDKMGVGMMFVTFFFIIFLFCLMMIGCLVIGICDLVQFCKKKLASPKSITQAQGVAM